MARIRSTHPEQWVDEQFVTSTVLARLLAIGVRNFADDNGIFEWKPTKLKMQILPADNCVMDKLLGELLDTNQIARYEIDGKPYGIIRNFTKYQSPRKPAGYYPLPTEPMGNQYETPHPVKERKRRTYAGSGHGQYRSNGAATHEREKEKERDTSSTRANGAQKGISVMGEKDIETVAHLRGFISTEFWKADWGGRPENIEVAERLLAELRGKAVAEPEPVAPSETQADGGDRVKIQQASGGERPANLEARP